MRRISQISWFARQSIACGLVGCVLTMQSACHAQANSASGSRVIELTADKDSRYRQGRKTSPTIEVVAGEPLILRIKATQAREVARDGSIHGMALLDKDSKVVAGWRFFFHPGVQDVAVVAPSKPGRYTAVCTVICSDAHEGMSFTLVVTEPKTN